MFTSQHPNPHQRRGFVLFRPFVALWHWLFPPSVAHRDRQSKVARIVAGVGIVAFCVGMVVLSFKYGKPAYDWYQRIQSNRKIDQAEEFEKQGRIVEAAYMARDAYLLDPDNPKALRTLARYYSARGQKEAFYMLDRLERTLEKEGQSLTDEDRLWRIQALASSNEIKDAQTQIEELLRRSPPSARMVEIADQVMRQRGRRQELLSILRSYLALKPDDMEIRFKLGMREVQFGTSDEVKEGMKILWELAADPSKVGFNALQFLDQQTITNAEEQKKLIALLQQHPLSGEEQRVAALKRQVALEPARKSEIIEKAIQERKEASREDLVYFARWLTQEGEHERLLKFLDLAVAQDYPPLLVQYLNALTLTDRIGELEKLVKDPRTRLTIAERAFFRAHLGYVMKKTPKEVRSLLLDALSAAQADGRPQNFIMIAQWAEIRGHLDVAEEAYRVVSGNNASENYQRQGFEGLLKITYFKGDSKGFIDAARATARRWPENQHFMERSLYAALLAGVDMEVAVPHAQKLLDASPDDTHRKLLMALAHYRMLDGKAAVQRLNNVNLSELRPGQGAVLCGILYSAGDDNAVAQARRISQGLSADVVMLPEEKKFLQKVRPELAAAAPVSPSGASQPGKP